MSGETFPSFNELTALVLVCSGLAVWAGMQCVKRLARFIGRHR